MTIGLRAAARTRAVAATSSGPATTGLFGASRGGSAYSNVSCVLGQHLAGEGEVDGPRRLAAGDGERPIHNRLELGEVAQLVVPLHELARQPGLIEGLLRPVDLAVAAAEHALLGDGRAPGGEEDRYLGAAPR